MTDSDRDPERCARLLREAKAHFDAIGVAKQAATQYADFKPRQPVRLDPEQLAEAWRRSGLRNPRHRHHRRPILEVVA